MKKLTVIVAVFVAMNLAGCSMEPSRAQLASANYGLPLTRNEASQIVTSYLHEEAIDPDSVKLGESITVQDFSYCDDDMFCGERHYGRLIVYQINAKNHFGGYVGNQTHGLFTFNGHPKAYFVQRQSVTGPEWHREY